jgi:hypothetical protein
MRNPAKSKDLKYDPIHLEIEAWDGLFQEIDDDVRNIELLNIFHNLK